MDKNKKPQNNTEKNNNIRKIIIWCTALAIIGVIVYFLFFYSPYGEISIYDLINHLGNGWKISKGTLYFDSAVYTGYFDLIDPSGKHHLVEVSFLNAAFPGGTETFLDKLLNLDGGHVIQIHKNEGPSFWESLLSSLIPVLLIGALMFFLFKNIAKSGKMDMGFDSKSKAKISTSNLTFNDVAGYKEEKEELQEIVSFLTSPEKFNAMGVRLPRGVLLVGPAGTGKTLLAKAVAGEANVPFFSVSGSDFVEMFVGLGASRVRDLFKTARKMSPCIIFFDEIDAVGRSRGIGIGGGNDEREQTLNQILVELDGFNTSSGIVVMAATNRAEVLDPALLRPGRFDRKVNFHLPNLQERMQILKIHAKNKNFDVTVDFELIGRKTAGFSGAELENLINEAAILAVRFGKTIVTNDEINESFDRIIAGLSKVSKVYTKHEKELIAYHEAGHALIGLKMETGDKVTKVSIVPRGNAGGYTLSTPEEDNSLMPKKQLVSKIITFLGGRASEELVFGKDNITTGAVNDFEVSSDIIRRMVTVFGMSELGMVNYAIVTSNNSSGYAIPREVTISDKKLNQIDEIVEKTMIECYDQSKKILKKYRKELDLIAQGLLKYETLDEEDLKQILETHTIPEKNVEDLAHNKLRKVNLNKIEDIKKVKKVYTNNPAVSVKSLEKDTDTDKKD
ncbi:MAG: ATP-dependent zinc metalloprotease FtsH [Mycoplasma sp.]